MVVLKNNAYLDIWNRDDDWLTIGVQCCVCEKDGLDCRIVLSLQKGVNDF